MIEGNLAKFAERLDLFQTKDLPLGTLIADLEFLLGALRDLDPETFRQLRERWEVLEEVYSVAVEGNNGKLDAYAELLIHDAVTAMRAIIGKRLET